MTDRFPYERESTWSPSPEQRKSWAEALRRIGLTSVKASLAQSPLGAYSSIAIGNEISMTKGFAEEWVAWTEARAARADTSYGEVQLWWAKAAVWTSAAAAVISAVGIAVQFALDK
jgi:hypothetical protein